MTHRNDPHSPANVDPADYSYERPILASIPRDIAAAADLSGNLAAMETILAAFHADQDWVKRHGWQGGNYAKNRTCDHCGAWFVYGSAYRHHPTNEVIVVGHVCAGKTFDCCDRETLEYRRLVDRVHATRETLKRNAQAAARQADAFALYPDLEDLLAVEHYIAEDIATRFAKYGAISEKQVALLRKLQVQVSEPARCEICGGEHEADDCPNRKAMPQGKAKHAVTILGGRWDDNLYGYGSTLKILARSADGWKVWSTCPAKLLDTYQDAVSAGEAAQGDALAWLKGKRIELSATFERSRDDSYFGFAKRPRAKLL